MEYIVRVLCRVHQPVRVISQQVVEAVTPKAAECTAEARAAKLYGGHVENYEAQAVSLKRWSRASFDDCLHGRAGFTGKFA